MKKKYGVTTKYLCVTMILTVAVLLTGFDFFDEKVELLNDTLLVDLDAAIKDAPPGKEGDTQPKNEEASDDTIIPSGTPTPTPAAEESVVRTISIRDTKITYDYRSYKDVTELRTAIESEEKQIRKITLIDDYAEAHVYRDVLGLLTELSQNGEFELIYD